jgi:MFS family permease
LLVAVAIVVWQQTTRGGEVSVPLDKPAGFDSLYASVQDFWGDLDFTGQVIAANVAAIVLGALVGRALEALRRSSTWAAPTLGSDTPDQPPAQARHAHILLSALVMLLLVGAAAIAVLTVGGTNVLWLLGALAFGGLAIGVAARIPPGLGGRPPTPARVFTQSARGQLGQHGWRSRWWSGPRIGALLGALLACAWAAQTHAWLVLIGGGLVAVALALSMNGLLGAWAEGAIRLSHVYRYFASPASQRAAPPSPTLQSEVASRVDSPQRAARLVALLDACVPKGGHGRLEDRHLRIAEWLHNEVGQPGERLIFRPAKEDLTGLADHFERLNAEENLLATMAQTLCWIGGIGMILGYWLTGVPLNHTDELLLVGLFLAAWILTVASRNRRRQFIGIFLETQLLEGDSASRARLRAALQKPTVRPPVSPDAAADVGPRST